MSKKDYTKFSNTNHRTIEPVEEIQNGVQVLEAAEHIVESVVAIAEPEPVVEKPIEGRVVDCTKLNIRKEPKATAEIVGTVDCDEQVNIYEKESTAEFYKIVTAYGNEGYCMKKFIKVL